MFVTCTALAVFRQRLLNAALSVEQAEHAADNLLPGTISMSRYVKPCGSPSCVLGHYAAREDLQDEFMIVGRPGELASRHLQCVIAYYHPLVQQHFGITHEEAYKLFSATGCGAEYLRPSKPRDVVKYLRRFAARKWPQWGLPT